jgi:hypothetical protein
VSDHLLAEVRWAPIISLTDYDQDRNRHHAAFVAAPRIIRDGRTEMF